MSRNESIVTQFSTNAGESCHFQILLAHVTFFLPSSGVTWTTLHLADPTSLRDPQPSYYIPLPLKAKTNTTRFRWWQLPLAYATFWALDNVHIGGHEINPSEMADSIDHGQGVQWEFVHNAEVVSGHCRNPGNVLKWEAEEGRRSATTGQLIIQKGMVIQFKVR